MMHYYNEFDPRAAAWLRELVSAGLIPKGDVDERSIADVGAGELSGYAQCHFFAGIGGWAYALRLAGWPADRPVWTGSCPCQPFSCAGKGKGKGDERHLWPEFYRLIRECRPPAVFGEQVANAVGHRWLDDVCADLEGEGYAVGAAVLGAHSVGAPHIRQRLYWVANTEGDGTAEVGAVRGGPAVTESGGMHGRVAHRRVAEDPAGIGRGRRGNGDSAWNDREVQTEGLRADGRLGDSNNSGPQGRDGEERAECSRECTAGQAGSPSWNGPCRWHPCSDGKLRLIPAEPSLFPLAYGIPGRVGLLRGAGNAIVPQVAAAFIKAVMP